MQRRARGLIEVGAKLREGSQLPVLRQVHAQPPGHLLHRRKLRRAAHAADREADVYRRANARVKQIGFQENLTVGDGDDVCGDIGRDVAGLGLDDGQGGHAAAASLRAEARRALKEPGVQIKHVAGVGFASGRTVQQQGNLTVGDGLLREVVIHDQHVPALVHEVFAHRGARVGRDVEHGRRFRGAGADDNGVVHRAVLPQFLHHARHGGFLLPDGDVDADHVLALLVDDGVEGNGGFAGLAIADDELALTAADGNQRVNGLDAGLHGH